MNLSQYFSSTGCMTVAELGAAIGVKDLNQVRQWQHGYANRIPSPIYCLAIERATAGAVTRQELRPDDYWLIWPDIPAPAERAVA